MINPREKREKSVGTLNELSREKLPANESSPNGAVNQNDSVDEFPRPPERSDSVTEIFGAVSYSRAGKAGSERTSKKASFRNRSNNTGSNAENQELSYSSSSDEDADASDGSAIDPVSFDIVSVDVGSVSLNTKKISTAEEVKS